MLLSTYSLGSDDRVIHGGLRMSKTRDDNLVQAGSPWIAKRCQALSLTLGIVPSSQLIGKFSLENRLLSHVLTHRHTISEQQIASHSPDLSSSSLVTS